jgi:hypothetical protein
VLYVNEGKISLRDAVAPIQAARSTAAISISEAPHVRVDGLGGVFVVSFYKSSKAAKAGKRAGALVIAEHISSGGVNRTRVLTDTRG